VKRVAFAGLAVASAVLAGCSDEALSVQEACGEIKGPMLTPVEDEEAGARETAELLRAVGERGDDEVEELFGDAAEAIEYVYENGVFDNGNEGVVPDWVNDARDRLASTCGPIIDG
jgi:hypothetical protein